MNTRICTIRKWGSICLKPKSLHTFTQQFNSSPTQGSSHSFLTVKAQNCTLQEPGVLQLLLLSFFSFFLFWEKESRGNSLPKCSTSPASERSHLQMPHCKFKCNGEASVLKQRSFVPFSPTYHHSIPSALYCWEDPSRKPSTWQKTVQFSFSISSLLVQWAEATSRGLQGVIQKRQ